MDTSESYIKMCEKAVEIQEDWTPRVGDYVWRKYTVFGEEIDSQIWADDKRHEITILHFQSSVEGYWAACNGEGEERIFKTPEDPHRATCIWLPRQDQLQEMVPTNLGSTKPGFKMISELNAFYDYWDTWGIPNILTSWEQLWLAFVMKQKCNKVWTGEDWQGH